MSTVEALCFHRVVEDSAVEQNWPWIVRGSACTVSEFSRHLSILARDHDWVDETAVIEFLAGNWQPTRPSIWVTFDDGYSDNLKIASPILEALHIRPTLFLTTGVLVDGFRLPVDRWYDILIAAEHVSSNLDFGNGTFDVDLRESRSRERLVSGSEKRSYVEAAPRAQAKMLSVLREALGVSNQVLPSSLAAAYLTREELQSLSRAGWFIGPHGHTHRLLQNLSAREVIEELEFALENLEVLNVRPSRFFAWPDGARDELSMAVAAPIFRNRGIAGALTVDSGPLRVGADSWQLSRSIA